MIKLVAIFALLSIAQLANIKTISV